MLLARHLAVLLALTPTVATAAAPTWRWLTVDEGLDPEHVYAVAQTPDGRLWIATHGGVFRWDGDRVQRADGGKLTDSVKDLVALPDGRVVARAEYGSLWWIDGEESRLQRGPGNSAEGFNDIWQNEEDELVALHQGGLYVWRSETWRLLAPSGETSHASTVRQGPGGSLLLGSKRGWVKWQTGGATPFISGVEVAAWDARTDPDGTVWLLDQDHGIRHLTPDGELIETIPIPIQSRYMTMRGDELWWVDSNELHRLRPNEFGGHQLVSFEVPSAGPLFVDAEGSIWLGTLRGLGQMPDPSAQELTAQADIPQLTGRTVSATATSVWLGAWQGLARHDRASGETVYIGDPVVTSRVCAGADDVAWGLTTPLDGVRYRSAVGGDPPTLLGSWPAPGSSIWEDCAVASDGTVWFTQDDQLWRTHGVAEPEPFLPLPFTDRPDWLLALRIQHGFVWVAYRQQACVTQEAALMASPTDAEWTCYALPGGGSIRDLVVTDSGNVWATGSKMGLLRLRNGAFEQHPGVPTLPTAKVYALRPSPRGGVWVLGPSVSMRVHDRPESPIGWQVIERLSNRLGRLVNEPSGLVEDADGTLWFGGTTGLVTVPDSVRQKRVDAPAVFLADVIVDGQAMPLGDVELPRSESHLHLRFVSPSYKAPKLLRYRMQLDDRPPTLWEREARFDFAQLGAGPHRISVWASLDGGDWSAQPATISVGVPQPWFARWQTWVALLSIFGLILGTIMVIRHRVRLRLETLRTRIALDLHDEVGAGLASVGLLGGLLHDDLPNDTRHQIADRLVGTSTELGGALRAIVWSLRPSSLRIGELGIYLEDRARSIFGELELQHTLDVRRPDDTNATALRLDVLRSVQLVALEALHNAAKHANATRVTLSLVPAGRERWQLVVEDNGGGIQERQASSVDSGHGLESMARRAAEIGARFTISTGATGGTRVRMDFSPKARRVKG